MGEEIAGKVAMPRAMVTMKTLPGRHCASYFTNPTQLFEVGTSIFHFINGKRKDGSSEKLNLLEFVQLPGDTAANAIQYLLAFFTNMVLEVIRIFNDWFVPDIKLQ